MSRRRCAACFGLNRDLEIKQGQIAHMDQDARNNEMENLVFLCLTHHDEYDSRRSQSKGLTQDELRQFRKELHEAIDGAWRQPIATGNLVVRAPGDPSGHYERAGKVQNAELRITLLPTARRIRVIGFAVWGTDRPYGPNMGELDFEAELAGESAVFVDAIYSDRPYRLELRFRDDGLTALEEHGLGHFGMNVTFEGEYRRLS